MVIGLFTLAMYFLPGFLEARQAILLLRAYWINVAVIIAAFALILGVFNLLSVHWGRLRKRGGFFSLVTILAFVVVLSVSFLEQFVHKQGVSGTWMTWTFRWVLYPLQSSFAALLAFLLAFAAYRTLRLRRGWAAWLFLGAAMVVLAAQVLSGMPLIPELRDWLVNVWATAGLRGVLLGLALGTLATMMRVLLGFDRPASE